MIRLRKCRLGRTAPIAGLLAFVALSLPAQAPGTVLRGLFRAYQSYEDAPETRNGIPTFLSLSPTELGLVRQRMTAAASTGFAPLARLDEEHWMGLEVIGGAQLLRVRDLTNQYNGRFGIDMSTGLLTVLHGVDYVPFTTAEDAVLTAYLGLGYFRRALSGGEVFPPELSVPPSDLASLGLELPVSQPPAPTAAAAPAPAPSVEPIPPPVVTYDGYLRLWSSAGAVAGEMFAADKFGSESTIDSGDFLQTVLFYRDAQGQRELTGNDLGVRIVGRVRAPENPLREDELAAMLASMASASGGLDVAIHSTRTIFHIPSTAPSPEDSASLQGAMAPAVRTFEYLQGIALLSGDYNVVPEAAMVAPGFTEQELELTRWARMQRAGSSAALYPPLIDSGGKLNWGEFALFATAEFRKFSVPSMVVLIRRPGPGKPAVPYHAVCLYQVGQSWRWMDSGSFGDQSASDWRELPALVYGKDVVFRVVDVASEWLRNGVDESTGWLTSRLVK